MKLWSLITASFVNINYLEKNMLNHPSRRDVFVELKNSDWVEVFLPKVTNKVISLTYPISRSLFQTKKPKNVQKSKATVRESETQKEAEFDSSSNTGVSRNSLFKVPADHLLKQAYKALWNINFSFLNCLESIHIPHYANNFGTLE